MAALRSDPAWMAALTILTFGPFANGGIWRHVDLYSRTIDFHSMLQGTGHLSSGERKLLEVAASCFNGDHSINLWSLCVLDHQFGSAALAAIRCVCRGA
jgi:hypothetical protein